MGWGRMLLLGDLGQQMDIGDTKRELAWLRQQITGHRAAANSGELMSKADETQSRQIAALQRENEALELCVSSLARLLLTKGVVTRDEFESIARLIDNDK